MNNNPIICWELLVIIEKFLYSLNSPLKNTILIYRSSHSILRLDLPPLVNSWLGNAVEIINSFILWFLNLILLVVFLFYMYNIYFKVDGYNNVIGSAVLTLHYLFNILSYKGLLTKLNRVFGQFISLICNTTHW